MPSPHRKPRRQKRPVNPPLKELLAMRAADPTLSEPVRELARQCLAGEWVTSQEVDAYLARREAAEGK